MWARAEVDATEGDTVQVRPGAETERVFFNFYPSFAPPGPSDLLNRVEYNMPEPEVVDGDFAPLYRWLLEGLLAQDPRIAAGHVFSIEFH